MKHGPSGHMRMDTKLPAPTLVAAPGVALTLGLPASACIWDRDTLATEVSGIMDTVRVITGRFERNPPLYYEMRLKRVAAEVVASPDKLELYDDAGVACDRLGRDDEALHW